MSRSTPPKARAVRAALLVGSLVVPLVLVTWGGHRGVHMARNLLFPGAGVIDHYWWLALVFATAAIAATVLWLAWGAGWLVAVVVVVSTVCSGLLAGEHPLATQSASSPRLVQLAHEFPLVVLVVAALSWVRTVFGRVPGIRRLVARRHRERNGSDLASVNPVDRARAAAIVLLVDPCAPDAAAVGWELDVRRRARRVGAWARLRFTGDPFRRDHAHARTAQCLSGRLDDASIRGFASEADRTSLGVPCSEPSWVRPLDATLAALALRRAGDERAGLRWAVGLETAFRLHRGHRPAWWWTPLDIGSGTSPGWEHAAFTGLARAAGWVDDSDWAVLRRRALGAAARGNAHPDDERLIAAARVWLAFVVDPDAHRILHRPGVRHDPLACALDRLAAHLCDNPEALRAAATPDTSGGNPT